MLNLYILVKEAKTVMKFNDLDIIFAKKIIQKSLKTLVDSYVRLLKTFEKKYKSIDDESPEAIALAKFCYAFKDNKFLCGK